MMSGIAPNKSPVISIPDIVRWRFQRAEQPYYLDKMFDRVDAGMFSLYLHFSGAGDKKKH